MRISQPFLLYSTFLLFLSTFTSAWPWPRFLPDIDALIVRQDSNTNSGSVAISTNSDSTPTSTINSQSGTITAGPTDTGSVIGSASGSGSGSVTSSGSNSNSGNNSDSNTATNTTSTSYDARLPAGGVSMITPAVISGAQYFKIGDFVTFGWNYTSLLATPTAINVMATCTENDQLYTIAMNQTVQSTGAVTWDTGAYQSTALSDPLLTETYTLIIYDAASSISATAEAGYLAVYDQYTFGMYMPQTYVPLNEFKCATCSGALSDMERRALGFVLGMGVITVLSFTWFVGGLGVVW